MSNPQEMMLHDLNAIFEDIVYELSGTNKYGIMFVEVHLSENRYITEWEFPHLLTLCNNNNNIRIFIFVVKLGQLGIKVIWRK